jgi:hypothetical protein
MWGTRAQGITLAGLAAGASLIAGIALAQDPQNPFAGECNRTATPEEIEGARGAHQAAKQFYDRAEYDRAIQYWRDVFKFDCNAIPVLINLANAYEKLGDRQNAIFALEAYIKRAKLADPEADVTKYETKIANLKQLQQAQASPSASVSVSAPPPPPPPPPPPSATAPPIMAKPYGAAPGVTIGLGAAVMVVGGILIPVGLGKVSEAQANCKENSAGQWSCPNQADVDNAALGQTLVPAGKVALGVGAAAVVGGLVWEFLANKPAPVEADKSATGRIRLSPSISPGMTGATIHGSF